MTDQIAFKDHPVFGDGTVQVLEHKRQLLKMRGPVYDHSWSTKRYDGVMIGWYQDEDSELWKLLNAGVRVEKYIDCWGDEVEESMWFDPSHPDKPVIHPRQTEETFYVAGATEVRGTLLCTPRDLPQIYKPHDLRCFHNDKRILIKNILVMAMAPMRDGSDVHAIQFMADFLHEEDDE